MQITSSYSVEIRKQDLCFRKTFEVYRSAAAYLIPVFDSVWEELEETGSAKRRFNAAEHLVHNTKKNTARFDFDLRFPKMPSYLRRAAIQFALGTVSSYRTRLEAWKKEAPFQGDGGRDASGKTAKGRPVLQAGNHAMPVFYHDVMYKAGEAGSDQAKLKLFDGHDWVWKEVHLKHTDMEYLRRHWCGKEASAPALEKRHRKYFLRFTYTEEADLPDRPAAEQTVCAVDLGINTDAVCSIMRSDGTVPARKFISFPGEKDHLKHVLGRIRRSQREHGSANAGSFWAYAVRLNEELSKKTASAIVSFAAEHGADVIVFEYLEMKGKIREAGSSACTCGGSGTCRRGVRTWPTGKGCGSAGSARGIRARWLLTDPGKWNGQRRTTACAGSAPGNSITATCRHRTISVQDTLSENS